MEINYSAIETCERKGRGHIYMYEYYKVQLHVSSKVNGLLLLYVSVSHTVVNGDNAIAIDDG